MFHFVFGIHSMWIISLWCLCWICGFLSVFVSGFSFFISWATVCKVVLQFFSSYGILSMLRPRVLWHLWSIVCTIGGMLFLDAWNCQCFGSCLQSSWHHYDPHTHVKDFRFVIIDWRIISWCPFLNEEMSVQNESLGGKCEMDGQTNFRHGNVCLRNAFHHNHALRLKVSRSCRWIAENLLVTIIE